MQTRRQKFILILTLGFLTSLTPFSIDLNLPAFPAIARDLHTTLSRVSLTISFYFVAYAVGQILYGPFLDRFGRKPPIYFGLIVYIFASIGCMTATTFEALLVCRILSAIGGSAATVGANTMVRDYFPQKEVARAFSLLILVISASPFLAPSVGTLIVTHWSWRVVFIILSLVAVFDMALVALVLPTIYKPDPSISLSLKPIFLNFRRILKNNTFAVYTFGGAFCFAGLFVFVAGSPSIFFDDFKMSQKAFGAIFAVIVGGLITCSQLNHLFIRRFGSQQVFKAALSIQAIVSALFFVGTSLHGYGVIATGGFLFIVLSCGGVAFPNAAALALAPFTDNIGSAAALLGFLQEGLGGVIAASLGLLNGKGTLPTASVMCVTSLLGVTILFFGKNQKT